MADDAAKHGKTIIQDAIDYFKWAANQSETSTVKYIFLTKEKYDVSQEELAVYAQGLLTLKCCGNQTKPSSGQRDFMFLRCMLPEGERQVPDVCKLD